ncbi:3-isopropylmalate dehydratase small subunit [Floricoccus tropicus]|uniref:3-isopropylmalate dehydratase small subunit n=1 Tax=Floricoccus tropicus TaxID=1859473 RepID=A0A1E8GM27_9LACT|nr:3-isopropylmalate dehydratase small subunit [Floricoccus tropicus]OFI49227.1 3-isopropylmalate dehydratase small subunit [Floricoccus tropicus]
MEKFTVYEGTTVPLMNDNIDTDQIIPKQFLKATDKIGFGKNMFFEWRYLENGKEENPDFVLNKPQYRGATILISGDNFGSGSSREHAAWAIKDYGFKVIIAGSYSDIFYNNALKNGLLPIVLAEESREELANLLPDQEIIVDLPNQTIETSEKSYLFDIDAEWKRKLVNGLDDIGLTMEFDDLISRYEENRPSYLREVGI